MGILFIFTFEHSTTNITNKYAQLFYISSLNKARAFSASVSCTAPYYFIDFFVIRNLKNIQILLINWEIQIG